MQSFKVMDGENASLLRDVDQTGFTEVIEYNVGDTASLDFSTQIVGSATDPCDPNVKVQV